jgi:hypothetical protein
MASLPSIAWVIADHPGASVDAPTVPAGVKTQAVRPSWLLALQRDAAS